ncbi:hypothetical protein HD806DRAFT_518363 [Xylariaceae sp. AK1471]|nr:hypothetical protein HD806DRAFT_518363 [Xylariaceae sp. AK1471]
MFKVNFRPFYFFFYGSLQILSVLEAVCGVSSSEEGEENRIVLRENASIKGWKLKKWGPYPALVPADNTNDEGEGEGHVVRGVAWCCDKPEYVARICGYETGAYRMAYCEVSFPTDDKLKIIRDARTFVWARDTKELEDGVFDVEEYRARMGH